MQGRPQNTPFLADRILGGLVIATATCLGIVTTLLTGFLSGLANVSFSEMPSTPGLERPAADTSAAYLTLGFVFALYIASGVGVFLGKKWGFWTTIVFMGISFFAGGSPLGGGLVVYSALRLSKAIGPEPT